MPKPLEKKVLPEGHVDIAAFRQRLELALGVSGISDRQRHRKPLRLMKMAGRRVGSHQHLAVDRYPAMHDLLLPLGRPRHIRRCGLMSQHQLDLGAEHLFVIFERRFAIAVVEQIGIDLHRLLLACLRRKPGYFSVSLFRLARPTSKSLPTMLSMFMNTCISLDMNRAGPCINHVRLVASPCGSIVNSAML